MESSNKRQKLNVPTIPNVVSPDLPEEYKNHIEEMNGTDVVLVIQKALTAIDLEKCNNHLSISFRQISNTNFLSQEERKKSCPTRKNGSVIHGTLVRNEYDGFEAMEHAQKLGEGKLDVCSKD